MVHMMVRPAAAILFKYDTKFSAIKESKPEVGSSQNIMLGSDRKVTTVRCTFLPSSFK